MPLYEFKYVFLGMLLATAAVAAEPGDLKHPDWHPDGRLLIAEGSCAGSIDLYLIDLQEDTVKFIWDGKHTEGYPRWFSDGKRIVFHQIDDKRESRLFVAELSPTGDISDIQRISDGPFDIEPAPSPDGNTIAYSLPGERGLDIALLEMGGGRSTRVWKTEYAENFPSWHHSGETIIFYARKPDGTQVYQRDLVSDQITALTEGEGPNFVAALSPDGGALAYSSERSGDREIYVRNLASGKERRLTDRPGRDGYPKFSPDGRRIAYHSVVGDSRAEIRVLNLDTAERMAFACAP